MARHKNAEWDLPGPKIGTWEQIQVAVLMDIRDELQTIRYLLECPNVQAGVIAMARLDKHVRKRFPIKPKK